MQLKIKTMTDKNITIEIQANDTFRNVKAKIEDKEGIPSHQMLLTVCGKVLKDHYIVADHIYQRNDTVHLVLRAEPDTIDISIKIPPRELVKLRIKSSDTIGNVKMELKHITGIEPDRMVLTCANKIMFDDYIVSDYMFQIKTHGYLKLNVKRSRVTILLKTLADRLIPLEVEPYFTIETVKDKIQNEIGFPSEQMMLKRCGQTLEDCFSVVDYIFKNYATVYVVERAKPHTLTILVNIPSGDTSPVNIESSDTVQQLKSKLNDETGIRAKEMKLVYDGKLLNDGYIVGDYIFVNNAIINLELLEEPRKITVLIKTQYGDTTPLEIEPSYASLRNVKSKIMDMTGIATDNMKLLCNGKWVTDDTIFKDNDIVQIINIIKPYRRTILVKTQSGETSLIEIESSDSIWHVKIKIQNTLGILPKNMKLLFDLKPMENDYMVDHYVCQNNATVYLYKRPQPQRMDILIKNVYWDPTLIEMTSSDTILQMKAKIHNIHGCPQYEISPIHPDETLSDSFIVSDYFHDKDVVDVIQESTPIHKIFVKTEMKDFFANTICINTEPRDKMETLKATLHHVLCIDPHEMTFVYDGHTLSDRDYILDNATVNFVWQHDKTKIMVNIQIPEGDIFLVEIDSDQTVRDIIDRLHDKTRTERDEIILVGQGRFIDYHKKLIGSQYVYNYANLDFKDRRVPYKMTISIKTPSDDKYPLEIESRDTLDKIKVQIQDKIGIESEKIKMIYKKTKLKGSFDDKKANEIFYDKDTVHLKFRTEASKIKIRVNMPSGGTESIKIKPSATFKDVKDQILNKEGITPDKMKLIFAGRIMEDNFIVTDYLKEEDKFNIRLTGEPFPHTLTIHVKTSSNETIPLEVEPPDFIKDVKDKLVCKVRCDSILMILIHDNQVLEDEYIVDDYIRNYDAIRLLQLESPMSDVILVKTLAGDFIPIGFDLNDTIADVKAKLQDKTEIKQDKIKLYSARHFQLLQDQFEVNKHVKRHGVVHLIDRPDESKINIFVKRKCEQSKVMILEIEKDAVISDVKKQLNEKHGIPEDRIKELNYAGKKLNDSVTLSKYNISDSCLIRLVEY